MSRWGPFREPCQARIYMDGRSHPKDLKPPFMGHSIGRGTATHSSSTRSDYARELISAEESIAVWLSAVDASAS